MNTQQLKKAILQEAISGRLTAQWREENGVTEEWKVVKLGEVCKIFGRIGFRGYTKADLVSEQDGVITLSPSNIIDGKIDYTKCTYISWFKYEESPEIKIFEGDIILVKTASIGKVAIVENLPKPATINPQFVVLKEVSCDNRYLYYLLYSPYTQLKIQKFAVGTAVPTFTQKALANMEIPLPPIEEQREIVRRVEEMFGEIGKIEEGKEKMESLGRMLKKRVLEEAISGRLTAQWREENGVTEEWKVVKLASVADFFYGFPFDAALFTEQKTGMPIIRIRDVVPAKTKTYSSQVVDDSYIIHDGDMLIGMDGNFNREFWQGGDAYLNQRVCKITADGRDLLQKYLYFYLPIDLKKIEDNVSSTTVKHLSAKIFNSMEIPLPPIEEQREIVRRVEEIFGMLDFDL